MFNRHIWVWWSGVEIYDEFCNIMHFHNKGYDVFEFIINIID